MIAAVIVTCRRPALLARAIAAALAQTSPPERVLVIDNSVDLAVNAAVRAAFAADARVCFHLARDNLGGAGGYHLGLRLALAAGAEAVWLLDDDAIAAPEALAWLARTAAEFAPVGFVCSRVVWTDGSPAVMNQPVPAADWARFLLPGQPVVKVRTATFVSLLVSAAVVRAKGLPAREFFVWYDDNDYTLRITDDLTGLWEGRSVVVHEMARNEGAAFETVTTASLWKYRYGVRNEIATVRHREGFAAALLRLFALGPRLRAVPGGRERRALYRAAVRGLFFRYRVEFPKADETFPELAASVEGTRPR
ncbi:MAG: glycosyltransferase [Acetobacteraceae bacterium]